MLYPISIVIIGGSIAFLWLGLRDRKTSWLWALNALWWLGSIGSAYLVYLTWNDRMYSENWAIMGFLFVALPYALLVCALLILQTIFIVRRDIRPQKGLIASSIVLFLFLVVQTAVGFLSG